jgi:hypothetical protein
MLTYEPLQLLPQEQSAANIIPYIPFMPVLAQASECLYVNQSHNTIYIPVSEANISFTRSARNFYALYVYNGVEQKQKIIFGCDGSAIIKFQDGNLTVNEDIINMTIKKEMTQAITIAALRALMNEVNDANP